MLKAINLFCDCEKNFNNYVHLWVKIFTADLRVLSRKTSKILPCVVFLSCVVDEMFIETLKFGGQRLASSLGKECSVQFGK